MRVTYQVMAGAGEQWHPCGPVFSSYSAALDHLETARLLVAADDWTIERDIDFARRDR